MQLDCGADMEFGVLGPLKVQCSARDVEIGSRNQRRLLAALLVHAGTVVSADRLIGVLWGEDPPRNAPGGLYTYVSRLRALLHAGGEELLITSPPGYTLRLRPEQVDANRFERLLRDARRIAAEQPQAALARLEEALALWRGPAYAEFADAEFAGPEATRLDELRLAAMEERFEVGLALGRHGDLVGEIEAYAAEHPLREQPQAQLIRALYRCGRHAEALAVFRTFRDRLDEELGVAPSATLQTLQTAVLRQSPELDWAPPAATAADPHGGLPAEATSLVGRESDVEEVTAALRQHRLVTLTGVGGVGKTSLALSVAVRVADGYPDGVRWCELAPVNDGAAVVHALAAAVGAGQQPGWTVEESVVAFLAPRRLLLVVDNCEHVLEHAAHLLEAVVRRCPHVTLLATSRIGLGVTGERIQPTAPLTVPAPDAGAEAAAAPAVRLFVDRARAVRPDLDVSEENLAHIAEVCRHLDGLPLAIELAAARIRSLNPSDLTARVGDRFALLTTARTTVVPRHRTLRAVIDWSYALLRPAEQRLFARLSVFAGGFTLDAAEHVCREAGFVDLLAALVDGSLVAAGSTAGQVRYSMLETLRAYGRELLEGCGELAAVREAHARYYVGLAEEAERALRGPDEGHWITALDADFGNLRAAHRWAVEQQDADLALRLSAGLHHYAFDRLLYEVVSWGETVLDLPEVDTHPLHPAVCAAVAEGLTLRGELRRAQALAERALARIGADDRKRVPLLKVMAAVALYEGRLDDCVTWSRYVLRLARNLDDWYVAEALLYQGLARTYAGDQAGGLAFAGEALRVAEAVGNPSLIAWALYNQAEALSHSDPERARRHYQRAIIVAKSVNATFAVNVAQVGLAALFARSGEARDALQAFRQSIKRWRDMRVWHHQWTTLRNLLQLLIRIHDHPDAATLLGALGATDTAAYGSDADGMAEAARQLEAALGSEVFAAATSRGAAMSAEEAVAFALKAIDDALRLTASMP